MFNRRASAQQYMPDKVIESLGLSPGKVVADIGSGGGYYSLRFAEVVSNGGKVYAVDVNPKLLDYVRRQGEAKGLTSLTHCAYERFSDRHPAREPRPRVHAECLPPFGRSGRLFYWR